MDHSGMTAPRDWRSIRRTDTDKGYRVREDGQRFRREILTEIVLRCAGLAMALAGCFLWLLASPAVGGLWPSLSLSVTFGAMGLVVFLTSMRGFRREIQADLWRRELRLCKLNAKGQALVKNRLAMSDIESLFVRRGEHGEGNATLVLKLEGGKTVAAMRGSEADVTSLHRMLCEDLSRTLRPLASARPVRPPKPSGIVRTPRPTVVAA